MADATVVSSDGTRLAARYSGSGPPLVLVHGALGDLNSFVPIEAPLAEHHTVWVYSRRNRGGSSDGPDYSLEREVEDVLAVLAATGDDAHLFGHSAGAVYAMLAAPRATGLRSLMLYEPPLHADTIEPAVVKGMEAALAENDPGRAIEIFLPAAGVTAEELAAARSEAPLWEALKAGVRVFPRELRALQHESAARLAQTRLPEVPLLYLYGELTDVPAYPRPPEVAARYPAAELHALIGQRHLAATFAPEAFVAAITAFTRSATP